MHAAGLTILVATLTNNWVTRLTWAADLELILALLAVFVSDQLEILDGVRMGPQFHD